MSASILFRRDRRNSVVIQLKPRAPAEPAGALGGTPSATRLTVPSSPERLHCQTGLGDGYRTRVKLMVKVFDFCPVWWAVLDRTSYEIGQCPSAGDRAGRDGWPGLGGAARRVWAVSGDGCGGRPAPVPVSPAPSFSARWVLRRGSVNVHHLWPSKGGQSPRPSAGLWQPQDPKSSHSGHMICTIRRPLG